MLIKLCLGFNKNIAGLAALVGANHAGGLQLVHQAGRPCYSPISFCVGIRDVEPTWFFTIKPGGFFK